MPTGLDFAAHYLTFDSISNDARTALPGGMLNTARLHPDNSSINATAAEAIAGAQVQVFDLEAGTWFYVAQDVVARPFVGFRAGLIDQSLRSDYTVGGNSRTAQDFIDLDAYGLRAGSDVRWALFQDVLHVEGGAAGSLLIGHSRARHFETGSLAPMDVVDDYNNLVTSGDIYTGLVYQRGGFFMSGGVLASAWLNTGSYLTYTDDVSDGQHVREQTDLLLAGGYFRLGWNW